MADGSTEDLGRIELPQAERGVSAEDIKLLERLNRRLTANAYQSDKKMSAQERREADLRAREDLERKHRNRQADAAHQARLAETEALAGARGEAIVTDKTGVKRILDRDPLVGLAWLTKDQFEAGQAMREAYLMRADDLGAVEFTGAPGSPHDNDKFVWSRHARAKATNLVARVERRVALDCRHEPEALNMLRWVCEQGNTITSKGRGRSYDRNCHALALALNVADLERR